MSHRFQRSRRARALAVAVVMATVGCAGTEVPTVDGVMGRDTFIDVYTELRVTAVQTPELVISAEDRDRILASHGVDEADLVAFVEAYGSQLDFMNEVWAEVDGRIEALPPMNIDSLPSGG